ASPRGRGGVPIDGTRNTTPPASIRRLRAIFLVTPPPLLAVMRGGEFALFKIDPQHRPPTTYRCLVPILFPCLTKTVPATYVALKIAGGLDEGRIFRITTSTRCYGPRVRASFDRHVRHEPSGNGERRRQEIRMDESSRVCVFGCER